MNKTEVLIVGQGISGTFLSWYLYKAGRSFLVIDRYDPTSSSRVAAGIINPVTGRRIVRTWMIETLLPFAVNAYEEIGSYLGIPTIKRKTLIDFFPSVQMANAFAKRADENEVFLKPHGDDRYFNKYFNYEYGYGEIDPCYLVNLASLIHAWREELNKNNLLIEEEFDHHELSVRDTDQRNEGIVYKQIVADKIIFCDGIYSSKNKYFKNLPFALNKGEALVIRSEELPDDNIYKKGILLAPTGNKLFWVGSSHEWQFTDNLPSQHFLENTSVHLSSWLKHPFEIVKHVASIRPATVERRPFAGMHPHVPQVGILNGMGTKGCSLAPYFADQLVNHLTKNTPILPEADISRFSRILKSLF